MTWKKLLVAFVAIAVGGSLLGLNQIAGSLAVLFGLVALLFMAISGGAPSADRPNTFWSFARISPPPPDALASILITGLAMAKVTSVVPSDAGRLTTAGVVVAAAGGALMGFFPSVVGLMVGLSATAVTVWTALTVQDCKPGGSTVGVALLVLCGALLGAVLAATGVVTMVTGLAVPSVRSTRPRDWALILFGEVSLAVFLASPAGLRVWGDAPWWARPLAFVLMLVTGVYAVVAPRLVKALLSLALLAATVALASFELTSFGGNVAPCDDPIRNLIMLGVFTFAASVTARSERTDGR